MSTQTENKTRIGKRSSIDFNKHELNITDLPGTMIHELARPNSSYHKLRFINTCGILAVTGDFGNWIFCREFHPSPAGYVDEGYWVEKLETSSEQEGRQYSQELTEKALQEALATVHKDWGHARAIQMEKYLEKCLTLTDDTLQYTYFAYREHPYFMDSESVIFRKHVKPWLQIVFDGFEEICRRLKEQEENNKK